MTRIYLKLTMPVFCLLLALTVIARLFGAAQPPNPALRGFVEGCENKPQPCWYGIVPGVTTLEEAQTTIHNLGYALVEATDNALLFYDNNQPGCSQVTLWLPVENTFPFSIDLNQCKNLSIGDSAIIGSLKHIVKTSQAYTISLANFYTITLHTCYGYAPPCNFTSSPHILISSIYFARTNSLNVMADQAGFDWHGFVLFWRYCQLEPDFADCPT